MFCQMSTLRAGFLLAGLQLFTACDQWSLSVNSDGLLFISVVGDSGGHHPYRVRVRQSDGSTAMLEIPPSGQLSSEDLAPGMVELTLFAPPGCTVSGANPQNLTVQRGSTSRVAFDVRCRS